MEHESISPVSKVNGFTGKAIEQVQKDPLENVNPERAPNQDHFESLMAQERNKEQLQVQAQADTKKPSLIQEVQELNNKVDNWRIAIQPQDLVAQARDAYTKMDEIKTKLETPGLEIKAPVQNLLKRKLTHIDENLKIALDRAGVEYKDVKPQELSGITNPIERFLGMLSHGQEHLNGLSKDIATLNNDKIKPGDLLAIQIKVNFVQQELEFFTSLLNKSLESTKTLMNVQV